MTNSLFAAYDPKSWSFHPEDQPESGCCELGLVALGIDIAFDRSLLLSFYLPEDVTIQHFIGELPKEYDVATWQNYVRSLTAKMLSDYLGQAMKERQQALQRQTLILKLVGEGHVDWGHLLTTPVPENPLAGQECYLIDAKTGERRPEETERFLAGGLISILWEPPRRHCLITGESLPSPCSRRRCPVILCIGPHRFAFDDVTIQVDGGEWYSLWDEDVAPPTTYVGVTRLLRSLLVDLQQGLSFCLCESGEHWMQEASLSDLMGCMALLAYFLPKEE